MKKLNSIYSRNLFSMLLIALTGILVFAFLFMPQFLDALRQKQEEQVRHRLQQTRDSIDNLLETMSGLSLAIGSNELLRPYLLRGDNTLGLLKAGKELQKYTITAPIIADLFFCAEGSDKVVGRIGAWDRNDFGASVYRFGNISQETLFGLLDAPNNGRLLPPDTLESYSGRLRKRVLPLVLPVPANSPSPYAALLVLLDEDMLLSELHKGWDRETVVLLCGASPLLSAGDLGEEELTALERTGDSPDTELLRPAADSGLVYSRCPSQYSGLQYVVLMDRSGFFTEANASVAKLLLWLFAGFWALFCISFLLTRLNYRPIQSMMETAGVSVSRRMIGRVNENELVSSAIQALNQNAWELEHVIQNRSLYVRESLVSRLLTAQYESMETLREKCADAGISLSAAEFCPFFILSCGDGSLCGVEPLEKGLETLAEGECWLSSSPQKDCISGFLSCGAGRADGTFFAQIHRHAASLLNLPLCVFFGRTVSVPEELAASFAEIYSKLTALRALHISGVLRFDDERLNIPPEDAPVQNLLDGVAEAMLRQDGALLSDAMERLAEELARDEFTLIRARSAALETGLLLAQEQRRLKLVHSLETAHRNPFVDPWMSSKEQLVRTLRAMSSPLVRRYDEQAAQAKNIWFEDILLYIDKHLLDPDFSIYTVAGAFGMTVSAFSHMFKRSLSETFQSYTNRLKVLKAKELLLDTDLTLEEITSRLCYSNPSNFGRMFKSETNMTPSRFRRVYRTSANG